MENIAEILEGVKTMGIGGHIRPDGDCVGSCMALYLYVKTYYPEIQADVYLDNPKPVFGHIDCMDEIKTELDGDKEYDLFVTCDVSARDRLAIAGPYFDTAKRTACIDHHISNSGFAQVNHIRGEVSSACEVLYGLFDPEKVVRTIAVPIYTGMVHDTGVFQYSSTSPETMRIAGELMKTGFNFSKIIDESFYQKTYVQNQVMGRVLTAGVEVAMFIYEVETQSFKVSLRSNGNVDVSKIAVYFGGGGHMRAAGCDLQGSVYDVINNVTEQICKQFQEQEV